MIKRLRNFNFNNFNFKYNVITVLICIVILLIIMIYFGTNFNKIHINVGILFTQSGGAMAENEKRLYDVLIEYIKYYNSIQSKYYIHTNSYNPESNTEKYIEGATKLCEMDNSIIFGCWRSIDRKAILPTIEKHDQLLCYPLQYEGLECSKNVLYFGATPNQQINIGIEYAIKNISKNVLLIGTDYVFPRTANQIMKEFIKNSNANLIDEIYVPLDEHNFDEIAKNIVTRYSSKNIIIMNTINGDSNKYFFEKLFQYFKMDKKNNENKILCNVFPIMSFSLTENDLVHYNKEYSFGQYFIWNYSQTDISHDNFLQNEYKNNSQLLNMLLQKYVKEKIIFDDPTYHVFLSLLFFIDFLENYNGPYKSTDIRKSYMENKNKKILTPTGYLTIMENNHLEQPVYILNVVNNNRFSTIYRTPIEIKPNPWYNKFSNERYSCNNSKPFMGTKFLEFPVFEENNNMKSQFTSFY